MHLHIYNLILWIIATRISLWDWKNNRSQRNHIYVIILSTWNLNDHIFLLCVLVFIEKIIILLNNLLISRIITLQLLTDYNWQEKNELDLIVYFGCPKPSDVIGARTQYVTIEDEIQNALITLDPEENNLNIVYRDSARFTKYYSKQSKCQCFYTLVCSYSE